MVERLCRVIGILENGKEIGNYNKLNSNERDIQKRNGNWQYRVVYRD